jgi:hypothetical protein
MKKIYATQLNKKKLKIHFYVQLAMEQNKEQKKEQKKEQEKENEKKPPLEEERDTWYDDCYHPCAAIALYNRGAKDWYFNSGSIAYYRQKINPQNS